jgi:preprotein translocase subunit SecD
MSRNLLQKGIAIAVIVVASVYGIIGLPTSMSGLRQNIADRLRLGLDLQGGTHLVLQVMVNDAINAEADQTIERLRNTLQTRQIPFGSVTRIDAADIYSEGGIEIQGIPVDQTTAFRQAMDETEFNWTYQTTDSGYRLSLRPLALAEIRQQTLNQSVETIRNRVDSLGVSEPTIQERGQGEFEILVQLPGVDDPARVKEIMQTTALLEIKRVQGGPYSARQQGLQAHNGILPVGTELMESVERPETGDLATQPNQWYLVGRVPAITGRDLRNARPGRD